MKEFLCLFLALGGLAACGTTATQQASLVSGAVTLAQVAAAKNTTAANLVTQGTLFCSKTAAGLPLVVALANVEGAPVSVTNQAAAAVTAACQAINAIPVVPPANPATALVISATTTLPVTPTP